MCKQLSLEVYLRHADTKVSLERCPYKPEQGEQTHYAKLQKTVTRIS